MLWRCRKRRWFLNLGNRWRFDEAQPVFIEGETPEVAKLLRKSCFGKVKLICIDPPRNTGNDFICRDGFSDQLAVCLTQTGQMTEDGHMTRNLPEKRSGDFIPTGCR